MKMTLSYCAALSGILMSISLSHAESPSGIANPNSQLHGDIDRMIFNKLDTNGDGFISRKEFDAYNAKHFNELDTNKDGKLSLEELQGRHNQAMSHGDGTTHLDERFNAADANHDGGLDREEAKNMPMLSQYFDEIDTNHDGKVTRQEYFDAMPLLHGVKKIDANPKKESM
jgi:Ca2+-binding EF-hand superfamily protein